MLKFITNFKGKREWYYKRASEIHNLNYEIKNEAYTSEGKLIDFDNYKAFYVDSSVNNLSDFWRTFELLEESIKC